MNEAWLNSIIDITSLGLGSLIFNTSVCIHVLFPCIKQCLLFLRSHQFLLVSRRGSRNAISLMLWNIWIFMVCKTWIQLFHVLACEGAARPGWMEVCVPAKLHFCLQLVESHYWRRIPFASWLITLWLMVSWGSLTSQKLIRWLYQDTKLCPASLMSRLGFQRHQLRNLLEKKKRKKGSCKSVLPSGRVSTLTPVCVADGDRVNLCCVADGYGGTVLA